MSEKPKRRYGKYYLVKDGKIYGIAHIRQPDGSYKKKLKVCENKQEAKNWAIKYLSEIKEAKTYNPHLTFCQLAKWYSDNFLHPPVLEKGLKVSGTKDFKRSKNKLEVFVNFFGDIRCVDFSESDLRAWQTHRRKENPNISQTTLNRDFELLRVIFRAGLRNKKIKEIPNFDIINNAAETERDRVLTFEEEKRLLAVCVDIETVSFIQQGKRKTATIKVNRAGLKPIIIMAVDTAMRANEIFTLTWDKVDLEERIISIEARFTKTQRARKVPISERLFTELLELRRKTERNKVFTYNRPPVCFVTACKRAKIGNLTFHDLRHTATTRFINAGIPYGEVMKITGHSELKTFLRYLNPTNTTITNTAKLFSDYLQQNL